MIKFEPLERETWLRNLLEVVAQFASEEFQQSAWVGFNGPDGATFEEAYELLEDFRLSEALYLPINPYYLDDDELRTLSEFWSILDDYSTNIYEVRVKRPGESYASPSRIVSQPEWQQVRKSALNVLKHFKAAGFPHMPKLPIFDRNKPTVLQGYWEP
jgi:hypothetical protein